MLPGIQSSDIIVSFDKASISRAAGTNTILHEVTMDIYKGVTMIIGPVGSGKSTLLEAILGDHILETGRISDLPARMAYCSQVPWIRNRSIRENITEEMVFDQKWYEFAISASGLQEDLKNIPGGDARVTGSSGITLSGGQKHRIVSFSTQVQTQSLYA
jgi:ATP-binding cassette, subfamily C (CFTR/MRP), member 1